MASSTQLCSQAETFTGTKNVYFTSKNAKIQTKERFISQTREMLHALGDITGEGGKYKNI